MPLPDGWTGLVHGVPAWFTRLLGASRAQVPAGTEVYAQNVDVINRDDRLLGRINVMASGGATADNQVIMITSLQLIDDLRNALASIGLDQLRVDVITSALPALAATAANQVIMITSLQLIDDLRNALGSVATDELRVEGPDAHDAGTTTNPVQLGGVAETTRPAVVTADGDAVRAWFDRIGRLVVQIGSAESNYYADEWAANQTGTELIATPGANLQICIYDILVSTGTMGTVLFEEGGATRLFGTISLAADGGWSFNSAKGIRLTANTSLTIDSTTGAGPLAITVNYAILPTL